MNGCCWRSALVALALVFAGDVLAQQAAQLQRAAAAFAALDNHTVLEELNAYEQRFGRDADTLYLRARVAVVRGKLDLAGDIAAECVKAFPQTALCHEARGEVNLIKLILDGNLFTKVGAAGRARRSLEQALKIDPDNPRPRLLLVRFHALAPWFLGGSERKARRHIEACWEHGDSWGYEAQAMLDLAKGRAHAAVDGFSRASALRPEDRSPAYLLAQAYLADHQPEAALATLERLVQKYPNFLEAWLMLGFAAAEEARYSRRGMTALSYYLDRSAEEDPERRARAAAARARLYLMAQDVEAALADVRLAVTLAPRQAMVREARRAFCRASPSRAPADVCSD